ncbi:AEC family transporter [Pseudoflavonifractor sp. 524-17]|uniref:AEC family transporter n=1 Tax=Pseudoflavonifractor sp. 524-17 TaxID=2304577 RepID=UPI001379476B|nr:AEC family transporter [Pseudoflavonifractor sp. 524-17]
MNEVLENLLVVVGQVGVLFLLMSVGFVMAKLGRLTPQTLPQLSFLLMYIVTPCVIIHSLQVEFDSGLLHDLLTGTGLVAVTYVVIWLGVLPFFRKQGQDSRETLRFAAIFGNTGFMGFPLITAIFGAERLIFAMPVFVVFQVFTWSLGVYMMGGKKELSLKNILVSPAVVGIAVGLPLFLTGAALPAPLGDTVSFLADLNTPLAMLLIGAQMAAADLPATFRSRSLYGCAAYKLLAAPAATALLLLPFGLSPMLFACCVILAGTPTAGVTAMFAERFNRGKETAAQAITLATLLSILTLPLTAVAAQRIAGL